MKSSDRYNSFRQNYPELYNDFFVNFPLIVSSSGGIILSGAFSHQYGGLGLHYKIPMRNFVGIKVNDSGNLTYRHYGTRDVFADKFIDTVPLDNISEKFNYFLDRCKVFKGENFGAEIGILNEIPRRHGLNNPGANAANLAIAFLLLTDQINENILNLYQFGDNALAEHDAALIEKTAKEFHEQWIGPNNSGFGALACLRHTGAPIAYQMNTKPTVKPLNEVFKFSSLKEIPYDIVVIGTADRSEIDFNLRSYDQIPNTFQLEKSDIDCLRNAGFVIDELQDNDNDFINNQYRRAIDASALASTVFMGHFLQDNSTNNQNRFFYSLNNSYSSLGLVDNNFSRKAKISVFIQDYFFSNLPDIPFALTTSIANHLVLFVIKEHFRDKLPDLISHLEEKVNFPISYPYISWRDGIEENGLIVEQWEDHGIMSDYLPNYSMYLKILNPLSSTTKLKHLNSREDKIIESFDIIFDMDDKKVLVKGQKLTSKDLPSVPATNNLIDLLLSKHNLIVDSSELPEMSYFQDRNELQSKIVSPLRELTEKYLGRALNIKITGEITNFKVSLLPSSLAIALIKRKMT